MLHLSYAVYLQLLLSRNDAMPDDAYMSIKCELSTDVS